MLPHAAGIGVPPWRAVVMLLPRTYVRGYEVPRSVSAKHVLVSAITQKRPLSTLARKFGDVFCRGCYAAFLNSISSLESEARTLSMSSRVNFHSNGSAICS